MSVIVKICGIRSPEAAHVAAEAGADLIGLVFAPSKRRVEPAEAQRIVARLRETDYGRHVGIVGVFVDEPVEQINALAVHVGLDWAQLSGRESPDAYAGLAIPAIKTIRFDGHRSETEWLAIANGCDGEPLHVDAHMQGSFGGAGVVADWAAAGRLARERAVLLAGGLSPTNVAAAINVVSPWGVDVSSGVETGGIKDHRKIRAFVHAAKQAAVEQAMLTGLPDG